MNQAFLKQHFCREKIYISGKMHLFICTLQIRAKNFKEYRFYCSDGYGTMLWNLRSDYCEKYLKFSKHGMYNLHMTDTYLVEHYFAAGQPSLRKQTFRKYSKFVQKLLQFPSKEICFLSKVLLNDPRSTLCKNVWFLNDLTNVNIVRQTNFR